MVAAILEDGKITWASVGDSHLYLVRNRELIKKNADHSYAPEAVAPDTVPEML